MPQNTAQRNLKLDPVAAHDKRRERTAAAVSLPKGDFEFFTGHIWVRSGTAGYRLWSLAGHEFMAWPLIDDAERQVYQKSAQLGFSTLRIGKCLHRAGGMGINVGYYLTTDDFIRSFCQSKLDPLIDKDALLAQLVTDGDPNEHLSTFARRRHKRADHTQLKQVGDGTIWLQGCQVMQDVKSIDLDAIELDEVDELDEELSKYIDDRTLHSDYKRRCAFSQPSVPGFGINAEYEASDQKRLMLRCSNCGKWTNLEDAFPNCFFGAGDDVRFGCHLCGGGKLPYLEGPRTVKFHASRGAAHQSRQPKQPSILDASGRICARWEAAFPERRVSGYRISQLYGPFTSAPQIAADFEAAHKSVSAMGRLIRSVVGKEYAADRQPVTAAVFDAACNEDFRRVLHPNRDLLKPAIAIWAGIDLGKTHWLVIAAEFPGGLLQVIWFEECVDEELLAQRLLHFGVHAFAVDAGAETHTAKRLCKRFPRQGVLCRWADTVVQAVVGDELDGLGSFQYMRVPRTESLDEMCSLVQRQGDDGPRLRFPSVLSDEMDVYRRHFVKLVKKDKDDDPRQPYRDKVENHLACACCYATLIRKWAPNLHVGPVADLTGMTLTMPRTPLPSPWGD